MGLLGRIRQEAVKAVAPRLAAMSDRDNRPFAPDEVLRHRQHECVKVGNAVYHQDALSRLDGDTVEVKIRKSRRKDDIEYTVCALDGTRLGGMSQHSLDRSGAKTRGTVMAEVARPTYHGEDGVLLYIPRTPESIERERMLDGLKLWANLGADRWRGGGGERHDFYDAQVLTSEREKGKPALVVMADGAVLFEVTPRMRMYADLMERRGYPVRHLIAERRSGDRGDYYRVGFYF